jgi:hypothetical protein
MLCVDPVKRITVADIYTLDWFRCDLPDYLSSTSIPIPRTVPEYDLNYSVSLITGSIPNSTIDHPVVTQVQPQKESDKRVKWHLGIRSKSTAKEILLEIYQALKRLGFKWKSGGYKITVCFEDCVFELNLYSTVKGFLVDFKYCSGDVVYFMELCSRIIIELAIH